MARTRVSGRAAKLSLLATIASVLALGVFGSMPAIVGATPPTATLGTATSFSVLAGTTVTNTGPTTLDGDLGVYPGSAVTGAGSITFSGGGSVHAGDQVAKRAQADATAGYNALAGPAPVCTLEPADLTGLTLGPGVYCVPAAASNLTGRLILDAGGNADAQFIFRASSSLITSSHSVVSIINPGTSECNIFWQVSSSATLGTSSEFVGNILASTSITLNTNARVIGRALAQTGAVTMDSNAVVAYSCMTAATAAATATPTAVPSVGGGGPPAATTVPAAAATTVPAAAATTVPAATATTVPAATATTAVRVTATTVAAQVPSSLPKTGGGGGSGLPYAAAGVVLLSLLAIGLLSWRWRAGHQ
ncbi:MAG: ice-binding family protein [Chloroflexota bacterium]